MNGKLVNEKMISKYSQNSAKSGIIFGLAIIWYFFNFWINLG